MPDLDLSEFHALGVPRRMKCTIATALEQLQTAERAKLTAALATEEIPSSAVSAWLRVREVKVSPQTVARHRRRECACDA